jgi:carbonic anhydrase
MDSRAPIEIAFDQGLGDIFGVRVAGNVVLYAVSTGAVTFLEPRRGSAR